MALVFLNLLMQVNHFSQPKNSIILKIDSSQIVKMLQDDKLEVIIAPTAGDALTEIETGAYDCIILDLALPDKNGIVSDLGNYPIKIVSMTGLNSHPGTGEKRFN